MKYRDAAAFRQALEQRLKTHSAGDGARLARDRKRVVFERLLARLLAAAPGSWLLKGGFALDLRLADRARATRDVDIEWRAEGEEELLDALIEAASYEAGDFLVFSVERTAFPEERLGGGYRFRATASPGGHYWRVLPARRRLRSWTEAISIDPQRHEPARVREGGTRLCADGRRAGESGLSKSGERSW